MTARSLADALAALEAAAREAGVDPAAARHEGEALAATVSEPAKGAFVDWGEQTGGGRSAEDFHDAASRGRRYRAGPTPTMSALSVSRSAHAPAYAQALSDVALAACSLGEENSRVLGNAAMASSAQLGEAPPTPTAPSGVREPVPGVGSHLLSQVMEQLGQVQRKLTNLDLADVAPETPGAFPLETANQASAEPQEKEPIQVAPTEPPAEEKPEEAAEPEPEPEPKTVDELLAELDELVGLTAVKAEIHRQAAVLRVEGLRKEAGLAAPTITRHMIFNGNPGTGKTTVARLVAGIYRALGLLSKGQLVEVDRSELVAGYLGQTAMKTAEVVASAEGGVLFIDEAYSLSGDQYGTEAIDTLVKEMEDKRDDLVVIVAGYPVPMAVFISQNPGLESRFRTTIDFVDYTDDELVRIFEVMARSAEYDVDEPVLDRLRELLGRVQRGPTFGNARYVRNMREAAIGRHAWRLREVDEPTVEQLRQISAEDLDTVEPFDTARPSPTQEPPVETGPTDAVDWAPTGADDVPETEEAP
jgi:SpoVK/Ycf46/Vps4 family AAA+-type ATPase